MKHLIKINNYKVPQHITQFFYDGCHKIYLVESPDDITEMIQACDYTKDDLYNIEQLEEIYNKSCPLRFISTVKLKTIVPQFRRKVTFKYEDDNV